MPGDPGSLGCLPAMQAMLVVFLLALVTVLSVFLSRGYRRKLQENTVTDPTSATYNGDAGDRWVHCRRSLSVISLVLGPTGGESGTLLTTGKGKGELNISIHAFMLSSFKRSPTIIHILTFPTPEISVGLGLTIMDSHKFLV